MYTLMTMLAGSEGTRSRAGVWVCAARRGAARAGAEEAAGGRALRGRSCARLAPPRRSHWAAGTAVSAARPGRGENGHK